MGKAKKGIGPSTGHHRVALNSIRMDDTLIEAQRQTRDGFSDA
jgi:hypothetical protein